VKSFFFRTIVSVARSTPCKCVCRADQEASFKPAPGLPFVAMRRRNTLRSRLHLNQSPAVDSNVR